MTTIFMMMKMTSCKKIGTIAICLLLGGTVPFCNGRRVSRNRALRKSSDDSKQEDRFQTIGTSFVSRKNQVVEFGSFEGTTISVRHFDSKSNKYCKSDKRSGKDGKGLNRGKGKGKGRTCTTSEEPSSAPSLSSSPSISAAPSFSPSVSLPPSPMPSVVPSSAPSVGAPQEPSGSPSDYPTLFPSPVPTTHPSSSSQISYEPSTTFEPSVTHSPVGSLFTTNVFPEGLESTCDFSPPTGLGGTLKPQRLVFLYHMHVPKETEGVAIQGKVRDMELRIHNGLVEEFLKCNAKEDAQAGTLETFYIWSISSSPSDELDPDSCIQDDSDTALPPPEGTMCVSVQANLGMIAFFPLIRRLARALQSVTDADGQILEATGDYLTMSMGNGDFDDDVVLQSEFKGFVMPADPSNGPNVAAANQQVQSNKEQSRIGAGATAMALACLFLLVVVLLTIRRRKRRAELYLQHLEDMSSCADLMKDGMTDDRTTYIVGEGSFDLAEAEGDDNFTAVGFGNENQLGRFDSNDHQHDVHQVRNTFLLASASIDYTRRFSPALFVYPITQCTSAYCTACRHIQSAQPTFIPSAKVSPHVQGILDDLRHSPSIVDDSRSYSTPDTVNL